MLFLPIAEVALHLLVEDLLEKHVSIAFFRGRLYLFLDDVYQGIIAVLDDEVHAGVVVGALAVLLRAVRGFELRIAADLGEEQDLEDVADGEGPVEEILEEKVAQEVDDELQPELLRERFEVMVDEEQGARDAGFYLGVEENLESLEEVHVVEGVGDGAVVGLDEAEEGVDHVDGDVNRFWIIDVGLFQKYHDKDVQ